MAYINVGAYIDGKRPKSKTALKTALKDAPETVRFDCTAAVGPDAGRSDIMGNDLPAGDTLTVCGPDPYTKRSWYASVSLNSKGGIKVQ